MTDFFDSLRSVYFNVDLTLTFLPPFDFSSCSLPDVCLIALHNQSVLPKIVTGGVNYTAGPFKGPLLVRSQRSAADTRSIRPPHLVGSTSAVSRQARVTSTCCLSGSGAVEAAAVGVSVVGPVAPGGARRTDPRFGRSSWRWSRF